MKKFTAFLLLVILMMSAVMPAKYTYAASADLRFFCGDSSVEAEDEFTVYLEITSDVTIGDFEAFFEYNSELAEYVSGPACVTGGDGYLRVSDQDASPSVSLRSYVLTFRALKQGVCRFQISGVPMVYSYDSGNSMSVRSELLDLVIHSSSLASDNAKLASLRISPGYLTPTFAEDVFEYEADVTMGTSKLIVSALAQDTNAEVTVSGNNNLKVGENTVHVTVKAENGYEQEYSIRVWVSEAEPTPTPLVTVIPASELSKNGLYIIQEQDTYLCSNSKYKVASDEDWNSLTIPDGYEPDFLLVDGISLKIVKKADKEETCLIALVNEAGKCSLYRIDRREMTIQKFEQEIVTITENANVDSQVKQLLTETLEYEKYRNKMSLICGGLSIVIAVLIIVCIRLYIRSKGISDDEFED